tara:strand:+ start:208 stop:597 length:390 start_codon:yes stop_codon:yes gene_type:complete
MGFGTVAFDTLSVSGAITGTAKSVNADYLAAGTAKYRIQYNGSTNAVNDSLNHSSFTDNGTGDYTLAFTNSFTDTSYSCVGANRSPGATAGGPDQFDHSASSVRNYLFNSSIAGYDGTQASVIISGNLA